MKILRLGLVSAVAASLGGCNMIVLNPFGDVALRQRDLLVQSTVLMLLIIVPVIVLTLVIAWRYRAANREARYEPDWDHSAQLELLIWGGPLLIIICLGAITWMGTHLLDPYRPTDRIDAARPGTGGVKPLEIQVVALDWKWLFIYPEQNVAAVNELALPVDRPVRFTLTSSTVMNAFYVPALAGMIYTMPSMQTQLHAVLNTPGDFAGLSSNYSGAGFSKMRFAVRGVDEAGFAGWIAKAKAGTGGDLTRAAYTTLEAPSEGDAVRYYSSVDDTLFHAIVNLCVRPGKMCLDEMMMTDARGGLGREGIGLTLPPDRDNRLSSRPTLFGSMPTDVASICSLDEVRRRGVPLALPINLSPITGYGLPVPGSSAKRSREATNDIPPQNRF